MLIALIKRRDIIKIDIAQCGHIEKYILKLIVIFFNN